MGDLRGWWERGETVTVELAGTERDVFLASAGEGPSMTLVHGFPSSSHDWAKAWDTLAPSHALLAPDLLGFGASDKPSEHRYSLHEQADLVEAVWAARGVAETALVAHDYGVSVAQELLAREQEGRLAVRLGSLTLLNGGVYPDLHRPQPLQTALLDPEQGPQISALVTEELFVAGLRPTFAEDYDPATDSADIWASMSRGGGERIGHLLIRYIPDREEHGERWVRAMETTAVPLAFVWGMLDPVSGAHMAERIRERLPEAPFTALEDVCSLAAAGSVRASGGGAAGALSRHHRPRRPSHRLRRDNASSVGSGGDPPVPAGRLALRPPEAPCTMSHCVQIGTVAREGSRFPALPFRLCPRRSSRSR